jgi:chromosome segregation ATPase
VGRISIERDNLKAKLQRSDETEAHLRGEREAQRQRIAELEDTIEQNHIMIKEVRSMNNSMRKLEEELNSKLFDKNSMENENKQLQTEFTKIN